jgi:hypothetical protein
MASVRRLLRITVLLAPLSIGLGIATTASAQVDPSCCLQPDNGFGTATLPPSTSGCSYYGTSEIVDGLAPGDTIFVTVAYYGFSAVNEGPGGSLGGTQSNFGASLAMSMIGNGSLTGFNRFIILPLPAPFQVIDWSPRMAFAPVQNATLDLRRLQGQVTMDPDFDLLRVTGGTDFGMPSSGLVQLTTAAGQWAVSSYIDVWHRIDFVGRPGGSLSGQSGSTTRIRRWTLCAEPAVSVSPSTWSGIKALLGN